MHHGFDSRFGRRPRVLPWLVGLVFIFSGCQRVGVATADATIRQGGGERVGAGRDDRGDAGSGPTPAEADASLPLPDTFPKDVYRPRRYTVNSVLDMDGTAMVSMVAPGQVASLFADARNTMRAQGWTQTMAAQHSVDNAVLSFEKERRSATLSFNKTQGRRVLVGVQLQGNQ